MLEGERRAMKKKVVLSILTLVLLLLAVIGIGTTPTVTAQLLPPSGLEVHPQYFLHQVGEAFNVSIDIGYSYPLFSGHNLTSWEAKLGYNTTILDCLDSYEGPFLPSFGGPGGTSYAVTINDPAGYIHVSGSFIGVHTKPSGSGALAYVEFRCTGAGGSVLDLYDTILTNGTGDAIPHYVDDGYVEQRKVGDINGDGTVDIEDVVIAVLAFGSMEEDDPTTPWDETERWNPDADLNGDGEVDIFDLVIIGVHFGDC